MTLFLLHSSHTVKVVGTDMAVWMDLNLIVLLINDVALCKYTDL